MVIIIYTVIGTLFLYNCVDMKGMAELERTECLVNILLTMCNVVTL